jgi:hypothetical protein
MKHYTIAGIILIIILVAGYLLMNPPIMQTNKSDSIPTPTSIPTPNIVDIKATFGIITGNITRNFSSPKYHNLSMDVFITKDDPSIIYVKKRGITWSDFFETLPMKLTKDCLVTGDGESLCNTKGNLRFYLNDVETPSLLDLEIKDGDRAKIEFKY